MFLSLRQSISLLMIEVNLKDKSTKRNIYIYKFPISHHQSDNDLFPFHATKMHIYHDIKVQGLRILLYLHYGTMKHYINDKRFLLMACRFNDMHDMFSTT